MDYNDITEHILMNHLFRFVRDFNQSLLMILSVIYVLKNFRFIKIKEI
jgi:hypothetical protein